MSGTMRYFNRYIDRYKSIICVTETIKTCARNFVKSLIITLLKQVFVVFVIIAHVEIFFEIQNVNDPDRMLINIVICVIFYVNSFQLKENWKFAMKENWINIKEMYKEIGYLKVLKNILETSEKFDIEEYSRIFKGMDFFNYDLSTFFEENNLIIENTEQH